MDIEIRLQPISASDFKESSKISVDLIAGSFQTPHRSLHFDFSVPFHRIALQGICRRQRAKITKEELASGKLRIVVQSGEVGWEYVEDQLAHLREQIQRAETAATFEIIHLLETGLYDVAICDEISCLKFLSGKGNNRRYQLAFDWPMSSYAACIAVNKRLAWGAERMKLLNKAVKTARNIPSYLEYERQWIGQEFKSAIEKCYIG
jgi:hypothetical protein